MTIPPLPDRVSPGGRRNCFSAATDACFEFCIRIYATCALGFRNVMIMDEGHRWFGHEVRRFGSGSYGIAAWKEDGGRRERP